MSDFDAAVQFVRGTGGTDAKLSDDLRLTFYKYYKQATEGDCNTSQPGMFSPTERAKWNAWNSVKGISKEKAKELYVAELNKALPTWKSK